jgi:hypothetical protein
MSRIALLSAAAAMLFAAPLSAQTAASGAKPYGSVLAGKWTYRSFHNRPALVGDNAKAALDLIFAEAVFTFEVSGTSLKGAIDWDGGGLDLKGQIRPASGHAPLSVAIVGSGRPKSSTDGWEYDYRGSLAYQWPNGVDQVPALVGTVIRAKPHGKEPAGYVASFIAVKQP